MCPGNIIEKISCGYIKKFWRNVLCNCVYIRTVLILCFFIQNSHLELWRTATKMSNVIVIEICFLYLFQLVTLQEAKLLLNEDDYLIKAVYDYWVRKRKNCRGPSLIPQIKQEKRDGSTNNDPYVAFRRRTEKMQTRKVIFSIQ